MRRIIVKREKCKLFAIWVDYWCVLDFDIDNLPTPCSKEHDCIDCNEYCERLVSNKQKQLFIESCDETGNKKIIETMRAFPIKLESGLVSNAITIPMGYSNISYLIKTEGGIIKKADITIKSSQ